MIFDPYTELQNLEKQPEWCQVQAKIEKLQKSMGFYVSKFDSDPKDWIQKKINEIEEDLNLFRNILIFWKRNYTNMEQVCHHVTEQAKAANEGSKIMELIDDLRTAYKYESDHNVILSETFIRLCKHKGMEVDKMNSALDELRKNVIDYKKHINNRLKEIV